MTFVEQLMSNSILWSSLLAWFIAQFLKVVLTIIFMKKLDLRRFVGSGGMPSSHTALVVSLATSIGLAEGFDSPLFALATAVSLVVMYDAAGVRRAAGKQAAILNEIIAALQTHQSIPNEKLKELIGHTPIEVIAGALLGIIVSLIFAYS